MNNKHELEINISKIKNNYLYKLLPNYNTKGERLIDITNIFYFTYQYEDKTMYFFDDINDPIPEKLKMELFNSNILNQMNLCYSLVKYSKDDDPVFTILDLNYDFIKKYTETIELYSDIDEYPWFEWNFELFEKKSNFHLHDEEKIFHNKQATIDFIISKTNNKNSIEEFIYKYRWNNYGDELTEFFKNNPTLKNFSTLFRIKKIKSFLSSL